MLIFPFKLLSAIVDTATNTVTSVAEQPAKLANNLVQSVYSASTINPVEWMIDYLTDWRNTVIDWLAHAGQLGLAGIGGVIAFRLGTWLARKVWHRQDATWLRWRVPGDAQSIAGNLQAQGRKVRYDGVGVILVNAWDSGNVARALQAYGIQYEVIR